MTILSIVQDFLDRMGYNTVSTLAAMTSEPGLRGLRFANQWHRKIVADQKFTRLRDDVISFASVASQQRYGLPPSIQKIHRIWETTSNRRLSEKSLDWLRTDPLANAFTGTPDTYVPLGETAITQQPATTGLWAVSSAAGDTTQKVSVDAIRSGGYINTPAQTTITGTTRVSLGALTDYVDVVKFWLDGACTGTISLYDAASGGNLLAVIPIGKTYSRYYTIFLFPTPSSAITYYVEHERQIQDMSLNTDEPIWPQDFHWLLVSCMVYQELLIKKDPTTAGIYFKNEVQPGMNSLLNFLVNNDDYIVVPDSRGARDVGSNLGAYFPRGVW